MIQGTLSICMRMFSYIMKMLVEREMPIVNILMTTKLDQNCEAE